MTDRHAITILSSIIGISLTILLVLTILVVKKEKADNPADFSDSYVDNSTTTIPSNSYINTTTDSPNVGNGTNTEADNPILESQNNSSMPDDTNNTLSEKESSGEKQTSPSAEELEKHLYSDDYTEIRDVMNGNLTEKIGEYSLTKFPEASLTDDLLIDYYNNYVLNNAYNYYVILFTDSTNDKGIYSIPGIMQQVYFGFDHVSYSITEDIDYYYIVEGDSLRKGTWAELY